MFDWFRRYRASTRGDEETVDLVAFALFTDPHLVDEDPVDAIQEWHEAEGWERDDYRVTARTVIRRFRAS